MRADLCMLHRIFLFLIDKIIDNNKKHVRGLRMLGMYSFPQVKCGWKYGKYGRLDVSRQEEGRTTDDAIVCFTANMGNTYQITYKLISMFYLKWS